MTLTELSKITIKSVRVGYSATLVITRGETRLNYFLVDENKIIQLEHDEAALLIKAASL